MEAPEFYQNTAASFCPQFVPEKRQYSSDSKAVAGAGDHFLVEEFLDFSNEDAVIGDAAFNAVAGNSTNSSPVTVVDSCNSSNFSGCETNFLADIGCRNFADGQFSSELCVPAYDDLAELEWVSNFVEESFSSEDLQRLQLISGLKAPNDVESCHPETNQNNINSINIASTTNVNNGPIFNSEVSVPAKARSKRSRAPPCNWTSRLLLVSATTSSSSSSPEQDVVVSVPLPVPPSTAVTAKKNGQGGSEKEGERDRSRRAGEEMPALRHRQDTAVADGAHGPQDALQRLWGPIQVGPARAGVPARSQPDILADKALELAPEGSGAPTPEGFPQSSTTPTAPPTTTTIHSSSSSSERNGV